MTDTYDYDKRIQEIMENQVQQQAGTQAMMPVDFEQSFREGLGISERMKPIVEREASLRSELYSVLPDIMKTMPGTIGPTAALELAEQRQAPIREELETSEKLREYKYGRIEDIIDRQVQSYTAKMQKVKDEYDRQQDELKNLMDLRAFAEEKRQFEETLKVQKYNAETARISATKDAGLNDIDLSNDPTGEKIVLRYKIQELPTGQQEAAFGAIASFQNAKDMLDLLDKGTSTGPGSEIKAQGLKIFGQTIVPGQQQWPSVWGASSEDTNKFIAAATSFAANYIKGISGVAVSEQEYKRLMKALPNIGEQESVNRDRIEQLLKTIQNKYELQLGINFNDYPNAIPIIGATDEEQLQQEYQQYQQNVGGVQSGYYNSF